MKVVGFVGSARKGGNTDILVNKVLEGVKQQGAETRVCYLQNLNIRDCTGCMSCKAGDGVCIQKDDMQTLYQEIGEANGIILGSPIYMGYITGQTKTFLDRWFAFLDANRKSRLSQGKKGVIILTQGQPDEKLFTYVPKGLEQVFGLMGITPLPSLIAAGVRELGEVSKNQSLLSKAVEVGRGLATS